MSAVAGFVRIFKDHQVARNLAPQMTCPEVKALAEVLTEHGEHRPAREWIAHHLRECSKPDTHDVSAEAIP